MKIAIIPARSGSGRIKNKNIYPFCGKPLFSYPLQAASDSGLFDKIHVSTDSQHYADIAKEFGAEVDFLRCPTLAENKSSLMETLRWVLSKYDEQGLKFDEVCMIYATAALIEGTDLLQGYDVFKEYGASIPAIAVATFPAPIERAFVKDDDGTLKWVEPEHRFLHSQECLTTYFDAGAFIFFNRVALFDDKQSVLEQYVPYHLPRWKVSDINEMEDMEVAENLYLGRKRKENHNT